MTPELIMAGVAVWPCCLFCQYIRGGGGGIGIRCRISELVETDGHSGKEIQRRNLGK